MQKDFLKPYGLCLNHSTQISSEQHGPYTAHTIGCATSRKEKQRNKAGIAYAMKQSRIAPLQGNSGSLAAWYQVADDEHLVAQALDCQRMTMARSNHLTCPSALYLNAEVKTSGIQPKTQLIGYAGLQVLQELSSKEGLQQHLSHQNHAEENLLFPSSFCCLEENILGFRHQFSQPFSHHDNLILFPGSSK